jgi:D-tyrosyl-tRNA(Tyr) deacylase
MRAVIQRVKQAEVIVDNKLISNISHGLVGYIGFGLDDEVKDLQYIQDKIINLRIFHDINGLMNRSVSEVGGELLVISQFTLYGDARKGRRPSFGNAARPEDAAILYNQFLQILSRSYSGKIATGIFQADMQVNTQVDGPVTIILDSKRQF